MKETRFRCAMYVMLFTLVIVSVGSLAGEKWTQENFIDLWKKVQTVVVEKNLEEYKKLIVPADPEEAENMTQESFNESVEYFLGDSFPEWSSVKLLKFEQNDKSAILVLQLHMDDEDWQDWLALNAYRFILTDDGWKISEDFYDKSLGKSSDDAENQQRIENELKANSYLQL